MDSKYWLIQKKRNYEIMTEQKDEPNKDEPHKNNPNKDTDAEKKKILLDLSPNENKNIYSLETDVYFYAGIKNETLICFQNEVNKVYKSIVENVNNSKLKGYEIIFPPIKIHLNSPGGSNKYM